MTLENGHSQEQSPGMILENAELLADSPATSSARR